MPHAHTHAIPAVATHPINCPMCQSPLKVIHHQPESMFCACCGVSVTVPVYSWKKYQQAEHDRPTVRLDGRTPPPGR